MKCKICDKYAAPEKGFINISGWMFPLCEEHMKEYIAFKNEYSNT